MIMSDGPQTGADDADLAYAALTAALSTVPLLGPAAVAAIAALVGSPVERRRDEFITDLWRRLKELEARKDLKVEDLPNNDAFVDAVLTATQAAIRTSQAEKKRALRNAILNSALPSAPDAAVQQQFIGLVESFTDWHLLILKLFHDPSAATDPEGNRLSPGVVASSLSAVLTQAFPGLMGRREFYELVWSDLIRAGLINSGGLHVMMTPQGCMGRRTTTFGDQFLRFISEP